MFVLWLKLKRLKPVLKKLSSPLNDMRNKIEDARKELQKAQKDLCCDRFNAEKISDVKNKTSHLLYLNELEESDMRQKAKIDWIRLGDGNNRYFHASIKGRHKQNNIGSLLKEDGSYISSQEDIETEVLDFYGGLLDSSENILEGLNIPAIREGNSLN